MDNIIRFATPEEIEAIASTSDLQAGSQILAFNSARAVLRTVVELDPVYYGELSNNQKRQFIWGLETHMRLSGVPVYYFNVPASDDMAQYRRVVESWGAEPTSPSPEIRFRKKL